MQCSAANPCCAPSADPLANALCSVSDETSFYPGGFWAGNPCGNGVVEPGEQCDLGSGNGAPGSCCLGSCTFAAATHRLPGVDRRLRSGRDLHRVEQHVPRERARREQHRLSQLGRRVRSR